MFWLGGLFALELTTSTPDALCPPLEEARAAVRARVGDVRGDFHARFALVRTNDGRQVLDLSMSEAERPVLHRELPLDAGGCQDAAQAIALVLERYFDAVELPVPTVSEMEPVPAPAPPRPSAPPRRPREDRGEAGAPAFRLGLGALYDVTLGFAPNLSVGFYPAGLWLPGRLSLGIELALAPFSSERVARVREEEVREKTLQGAMFVPAEWAWSRLRAALGPWAQVRYQRAEAPSLSNEQVGFRWLPGVGGGGRVGFTPWSRWTTSLGFAAGAQLTAAATRFSVRRADGETSVVLVPHDWFAQGELRLSLEL